MRTDHVGDDKVAKYKKASFACPRSRYLLFFATLLLFSLTLLYPDTNRIVFPKVAVKQAEAPRVTAQTSKKQPVWFIWSAPNTDNWHWMPLACVESVFHFHPDASVVIFSNSMPLTFFDCFKDAGFHIEVKRYDIAELGKGTVVEEFVTTGLWAQTANGSYRYVHECVRC
jgi:hypothetical protein